MKKLFPVQKNRGMTYVEIIVVLGIFAVMSSVVMYNYRGFEAKIDIKNLASDIALKIVEAQKSSVNGKWNSRVTLTDWKPSYGVNFNISADKKGFTYFADLNNDSIYNNVSNCTIGECLNYITFLKNDDYIDRIDNCISDPCSSLVNSSFSIIFKRPDSSAIFPGLTVVSSGYIQITVKSLKSSTYTGTIKIYPSGRIQVN